LLSSTNLLSNKLFSRPYIYIYGTENTKN
jgi:hypothetical protein